MNPRLLARTLMMIAGALFMIAAAIGRFDNLAYLALGIVFLAVGTTMRPRSRTSGEE